jgi:hypothetical protein
VLAEEAHDSAVICLFPMQVVAPMGLYAIASAVEHFVFQTRVAAISPDTLLVSFTRRLQCDINISRISSDGWTAPSTFHSPRYPTPLHKMSQADQDQALQSIGNVSTLLRKAIGAALPVAPEQYLTISIPGTVVDLTPIENGGTYVYDTARYVTTPTQVIQAEGKLVDGMMPLSNIMVCSIVDKSQLALTMSSRSGIQEKVSLEAIPKL